MAQNGQTIIGDQSTENQSLNISAARPVSLSYQYDLGFSTYIDGSNIDLVRDVAVDSGGNIYVTGGTADFDLIPITPGNDFYNPSGPESHGWFAPHDVFVQKYDPSGDLLWSTRIGGVNYDRAYALEVDDDGKVYVAGRAGDGFYTTPGALQETFGGNTANTENRPYGEEDGFVTRLDAETGGVDWSTYFGGAAGEFIRDIDVGPDGTVHIAQTFVLSETGQHITQDAMRPNLSGNADDIYAQLSNDGSTLLYGTYFGGDIEPLPKGGNPAIIVEANGDINILTQTDAFNAPTTPGAFRAQPRGESDLYMVKLDGADGGRSIKSATYIGTSEREVLETHNLAIDPDGNFIVSGETLGRDLPGTTGGFQPNATPNNSGFISIVSGDASEVIASTYYGGSGRDLIEGIHYTDDGIFVTGTTYSSDLPVTDVTQFGGYQGGGDGFIALFSHDLSTLLYGSYFGGDWEDAARAVAVSAGGDIYIGGSTRSRDFPIQDAEQPTKSAWFPAGFLSQLRPDAITAQPGSDITITASARPDGGPAKAWVMVNGAIVGDISVTADQRLGQAETFSVDAGKIIDATDTIEVRYYNDLYKPGQGLDRNMFVSDLSVDGKDLFLANANITSRHGNYSGETDTVVLASNGGAVLAMADQNVRSVITLRASADLYKGSPIVEVLVNGVSVGEATVNADHSTGQTAEFNFGHGQVIGAGDTLELQYLNDVYGGPDGDRNVFFEEISIDNAVVDLSTAHISATHGAYSQSNDLVVLASSGGALFDL